MPTATVLAGIPATNRTLYRAIRFLVGDPVALAEVDGVRTLILRDIELGRARRHARADRVGCPADFAPGGGLSGDRETATAQALTECLRRAGVREALADRTFPLVFAAHLEHAGIRVRYDPDLGALERRAKDDEEVACLREAQAATERAVREACEFIAGATARADGVLERDGAEVSSERVRAGIALSLLRAGYDCPEPIVAGGPVGADCHDLGTGVLRTGEPVIVDVFPRSRATLYNGDCTRTVVHGAIPPEVARMHAAVVDAKRAATGATRAGVTGDEVHRAAVAALERHGFAAGAMPSDTDSTVAWCGMTHGTGHGVGLDVHEPPLLDRNGPALVVGDVLTIEPGLYRRGLGGVRVEDMVVVRDGAAESLNSLPEGLAWCGARTTRRPVTCSR